MRAFPLSKLAALTAWRASYASHALHASPDMDQAVAELRDKLTDFGIDLSDPDDFCIVWTTITVLLSSQARMVQKGIGREQTIAAIYAVLAAATPSELHQLKFEQ